MSNRQRLNYPDSHFIYNLGLGQINFWQRDRTQTTTPTRYEDFIAVEVTQLIKTKFNCMKREVAQRGGPNRALSCQAWYRCRTQLGDQVSNPTSLVPAIIANPKFESQHSPGSENSQTENSKRQALFFQHLLLIYS